MSEPQLRLIAGDSFLCERALSVRESALQAVDPDIERHALFADEIDLSSLDLELRSCSLFALGRHFVIRRVEKHRSAKSLADVVGKPLPEGTYLTLLAGPLKATHAVLKTAKASDVALVLPTPKGGALQRAARDVLQASGLALSSAVSRMLLAECGNDLLSLHHELRKMRALASSGQISEDAARKLCFNHTEATVYPFYDRLGEGKLSAALNELNKLQEDAGRIVGGIIRHFTRLVMVRLLLDQRRAQPDIASNVGVQDWLCRRLIGQAKSRSTNALARTLRLGVQLDQRIKQGRVASDDALMQLILSATSPETPSPG
jgi:DNA polymerase III delta subunit